MAFPDNKVKVEWEFSGGKCECKITKHGHEGRCNKELVWDNRGRGGRGCWEAHHLDGDNNNNSITNCAIFCWSCHRLTLFQKIVV